MSQPTHTGRDPFLDALRGLALFGILIVNMGSFKLPYESHLLGQPYFGGLPNLIIWESISILFWGKFFPIFSILFGVGLTILHRRTVAKGHCFDTFIRRRMGILLIIGLLHVGLLWSGDILIPYAVCGFLSFIYITWKSKTLLYLAAVIYLLTTIQPYFIFHAFEDFDTLHRKIENSIIIHQQGDFTQIFAMRLDEWTDSLRRGVLGWIPNTFSHILLGVVIGRPGILENILPWLKKARKPAIISLVIGGVLSIFNTAYHYGYFPFSQIAYSLATLTYAITPIFLVFAYVAIFSWIFTHGKPKRLLTNLQSIGRLSLSNYLLQSLLASIIFMPWGLGLYGKINAVSGLLLTLAIFAIQIAATNFWLRSHPIGPIESLWRNLSKPKPLNP